MMGLGLSAAIPSRWTDMGKLDCLYVSRLVLESSSNQSAMLLVGRVGHNPRAEYFYFGLFFRAMSCLCKNSVGSSDHQTEAIDHRCYRGKKDARSMNFLSRFEKIHQLCGQSYLPYTDLVLDLIWTTLY